MTICKKLFDDTVPFSHIPSGSVFVETSSEAAFMKLDITYSIKEEAYNAVGLWNGQLFYFGDTEQVIWPKKDPELVIEY